MGDYGLVGLVGLVGLGLRVASYCLRVTSYWLWVMGFRFRADVLGIRSWGLLFSV